MYTNSETIIQKIADCAAAIENASVSVFMETKDQALKDQMGFIEEQAKEIAAAIRSLEQQRA